MKKIMWLINGILPQIAADLNVSSGVNEGWLVGLSNRLLEIDNITLQIVFPQNESSEVICGNIGGLQYFGYPLNGSKTKYDSNLKNVFQKIVVKAKPNIVHFMGSEYPHCWSMVEALKSINMENKAVISIQGLVSIYSIHIEQGIPTKFIKKFNLRDKLKKDDIQHLIYDFERRGIYEQRAIKNIHHVIGRTDWDFACAKAINPDIQYHFNNETLRPEFYSGQWDINECEKYSIFISQATYPVKGFHYMVQALPILRKKYPGLRVYVGAYQRYDGYDGRPEYLNSQYVRYIRMLIKKYELDDCIVYCGSLKAQEMKERFLKSHVFVSPSTIENSPNSVGEAMILGVPTVSSYVGGVANMLEHGKEGFLYQADAPYMLAHYVSKIFDDTDLAKVFSNAARKHALKTHDGLANLKDLLEIYDLIINE